MSSGSWKSRRTFFLSSAVHIAPYGETRYPCSNTAHVSAYFLDLSRSMGWPNHFSQSSRNLWLSGCSDPGSVYAMTMFGGFCAMVSLAATADAAPAENHTTVLGVFICCFLCLSAFGAWVC